MSASLSLPADDAPVGQDVPLYRLVPTDSCDAIEGKWVFQSAAFDNATPLTSDEHPDDMSVVLGDTLTALERVPQGLPQTRPDSERWGVAVLLAEHVYEQQQAVLRTPSDEEPAHGDVRGRKGQKLRRRLKKKARWVVPPGAPAPS